MTNTKHTPPELEVIDRCYVITKPRSENETPMLIADLSNSMYSASYARLFVDAITAIREIAAADPVDMALDPTWAKRIALAAAEGRTEKKEG